MESQKPKKKRPTFNQNAAIRGAIRRIFSRSPAKIEAQMKVRREVPKFNKDGSRSKVDAVQYQCNICKNWVGSTHVEVDHTVPVIEVNEQGFVDWNTFVNRLFCQVQDLQVLCDPCHDQKTRDERKSRQAFKDKILLDKLEERSKYAGSIHEEKALKKEISKFLKLTKAADTISRAKKLKDFLITRITKED